MSDENIEMIQRGIADFNCRDFDAVLALLRDDVIWDPFLSRTHTRQPLRGKEQLRTAWESQVELMDLRIEPEAFVAVGADRVAVPVRMVTRGRGSEMKLVASVTWLYTIVDGLAQRVEAFDTREEALQAAMMSETNIELAQQAIDAFNRRDFDALLSLDAPEAEFFTRVLELEGGGPFRGHAGLRTWWQDLLGVSPDLTVETQEVRELDNVTVALQLHRGHGMDSGAPMDQTAWTVTEWSGGKAVWWRVCVSETDALKAAKERG